MWKSVITPSQDDLFRKLPRHTAGEQKKTSIKKAGDCTEIQAHNTHNTKRTCSSLSQRSDRET